MCFFEAECHFQIVICPFYETDELNPEAILFRVDFYCGVKFYSIVVFFSIPWQKGIITSCLKASVFVQLTFAMHVIGPKLRNIKETIQTQPNEWM